MKYLNSNLHAGIKAAFVCGVVLLAACSDRGGDGVPELDPDFIATEDPNRFLQFLNTQVGLPAGKYTIVAGTRNPGESGDFSITVTRDDGETQTFRGEWTSSDGMSAVPGDGNPDFTYTMPHSGGATFEISSDVSTCLYLLDPGGKVMVGQDEEADCANPTVIDIETPVSKINLAANAKAYYRAIDPDNTRDTLDKWKAANGFGTDCGDGTTTSCERHVIFRDTKDLGYGRDMYARLEKNPNGSLRRFAVFVRNFRVNALPGLQYTTFNLDAAIANNVDPTRRDSIQWHFGSNAIEFSTYPYGEGEPREDYAAEELGGSYATNSGDAPLYAKFFTFRPDDVKDPNTTERRLELVNLDGRGDKSMPGPCIACHGGMSRPLLPNGNLPAPIPGGIPGDTQSQMQVVEVSTVTFSDVPDWTCEDIIGGIHFVNQGVLSTYETMQSQYGGVSGYWQPEFAAELIKGWYGDTVSAEDPADFTIEPAPGDPDYDVEEQCDYLVNNFYDYIPAGWQPDPVTGTPPPGADDLFREVIAPNCMVCHSRRGTNLGTNETSGFRQDIDFSSYERFISHAEQVERFIFHKGVMPLGGLNFDAFWDNSGPGRAELLASHLPDFNSLNEDGTVRRPGTPIAVIAAPGNTNVPVIISAEGSSFASTYRWSIVNSPEGSNPTLDSVTDARVTFDTDTDGEYRLQLVVGNGNTQSEAVTATITVNSSMPLPSSLRFDPHIKNVLQNDSGPNCDRCHAPAGTPGAIAGVPVHYTDTQVEGRQLYWGVLQRINFKEPIESALLRKPTGNHHFGRCREGFDLTDTPDDCEGVDGDRSNYDLFLNWILQGAPR